LKAKRVKNAYFVRTHFLHDENILDGKMKAVKLLLEALASIFKVNARPTFDVPLASLGLGVNTSVWTTGGKEVINGPKLQYTLERTSCKGQGCC